MKRTRHDGAAFNMQQRRAGAVHIERKRRRGVALIRDDRKTMVNDVAVAIEQAATRA